MAEERKYWNMEMESILNTPKMKEIQLRKVKKQVDYLYQNSSYFRKKFDDAGAKPETIKTLDDFSRRIPLFDKEEHRIVQERSLEKYGHSLGVHLCIPPEKITLLSATSGTTGLPTWYPYTTHELEILYEGFSRAMWRAGVRPGDRVIHAFGLGVFVAGAPIVMALQHYGACVLPVGAESGGERVLRMARLIDADVLFCTPSFAEYLIEKAPAVTGKEAKDLGIKAVMCGGEPGAGIPEVRKKIENAFGAKLFDLMGLGFVQWFSCDYPEYQGMHFITEDLSYLELVDPDTQEPIPTEDGARGAIVYSPLDSDGPISPPRYMLGDIMEVSTYPCPCGTTGIRYKHVGRIDDMLKVKGVLVYPAAIDNVITSFTPRVTGEFRIILDEPPPRVKPPLKLKVEYGEGVKKEDLSGLGKEIEEKMHNSVRIRPKIEWIPPMTLERATHKTQFIERTYEVKKS